VDKDQASALLALRLDAELLITPTGVDQVAVNFGRPDERWLSSLTVTQARELASRGQFGEGSMRPKVEALADFVARRPGAAGLITSPGRLRDALGRKSGTWIEG
jgi:carbamate kinase